MSTMPNTEHEPSQYGVKYYDPSPSIVEYLDRELQSLEPNVPSSTAGERRKFKRKKEGRGKIAKDKKDTFQRIFQGFADLVYFLEFIESHPELHELYEGNLKDLYGITTHFKGKRVPGIERYEGWHWSLFVRFLSATLFNRMNDSVIPFDFRTALAYVMIFQAIEAMRRRLTMSHNYDELKLFNSALSNTELWCKLLASRYDDKDSTSRHRIHF